MSKYICKTCGSLKEDHHDPDWLEIPDSCVCDWREWDSKLSKIKEPCKNYESGGGNDNMPCVHCEHDIECHK